MKFNLETWKHTASEKYRRISRWLGRGVTQDAPYVVYGTLAGLSLWPLVEAAQADQMLPAIMALGSVAGGVGGNLIAEQVQRWVDRAEQVNEAEVAQWVREQAGDAELRAALDAILDALQAVPQARAGLDGAARQWFTETLSHEMAQLGNLSRFEATLVGEGDIAQDHSAVAKTGGVAVVGDVHGDIVVTLDKTFFRRVIGQASPPDDLRQATQRYMSYLVDRYRYLDFRGMGVSDRVPLRLALRDLYVPLKARIELPRGETWARDLLVAGRAQEAERLSERIPLLDLLEQHSCLVVLGDPGAGKTTFLKVLALQLATGGHSETRLPVLVPLSAYANALAEETVRLDDFIAAYFHDLGANLPIGEMVCQALDTGSALIMLDGLDEVKDVGLRDTVVRQVVDFYTFHRPSGNKFLLTSRIIGYRAVRPIAEGLTECTLVDFQDSEIEAFVTRWTKALEKAARGDTPVAAQEADRERKELLDAVRRNPGVRRLAANPLLLTVLALMKRQGVTLPERRVELYQKYIETLLSSWNRARGLGRPPTWNLDVVETIKVLAPLALWMHQVNPGVGVVKQGDLTRQLEAIYLARGHTEPEWAARSFLFDVRENAGLLLERGAGQYGFIHLTFEEYLAAVALAQLGQQSVDPVVTALSEHIGDAVWREVSLLTVGYLGIVQQREQAAGAVVRGLVERDAGEPGEAAVLAGDAVADAWPGGVTADDKANVVDALLTTLHDDGRVKARFRAAAGRSLARLGDPRFRASAWDLPDEPLLGFVEVPTGPFPMGTDADDIPALKERFGEQEYYQYEWETPQRQVTLPAYLISRYPVTNAQFQAFAADGGYGEQRYWGTAAQAGVWQAGRVKRQGLEFVDGEIEQFEETANAPKDFGEPFNLPNHPVVGVNWYEARAYCAWLTEKLRTEEELPTPLVGHLRDQGWLARLPSEAEWEKAARGEEGRHFPWEGDQAAPNRANYDDTGIGSTSAVGCFPGGASPYGCLDMAGNVWEWCATHWQDSYTEYADDNDPSGNDARVLRGGAFDYNGRYLRCAYRNRDLPHGRYLYVGFRVVVAPG